VKFKSIKKIHINFPLIFKLVLWGILCAVLMVILLLLMKEKNYYSNLHHNDFPDVTSGHEYHTINDIRNAIGKGTITAPADLANCYNKMVQWTEYPSFFPIIGFSLMYFIPGTAKIPSTTAPADAWSIRWNAITLSYSYFFITIIIAFVALAMLLYNGIAEIIITKKYKKLNLSCQVVSKYSYRTFTIDNVTEFIINLTLVFAFFNFLSTCVVIAYWIFLSIVKLVNRKKKLIDVSSFEVAKSDLYYLIGIMLFQNLYTITKAYFINSFGVNLDLIMSIILPIGTITVIIGLFIKNLMSSKVSQIKKNILSSEDNVGQIRMFVSLQGTKAFEDYDFMQLIPSGVKQMITSQENNKTVLMDTLLKYDETVKYIENLHVETNNKLKKLAHINKMSDLDKKYLIYVSTNLCKNLDQLDSFFTDVKKLYPVETK